MSVSEVPDGFWFKKQHFIICHYSGGAFAAIGPIVAPVIRSTVSKIVPAAERGDFLQSQLTH